MKIFKSPFPKISLVIAMVLFVMMTDVTLTDAQCSMCKAVAESGAKDNASNISKGLNNGILYLLSIPYLLGGVAFFIWRKNRRQKEQTV